MAALPKPKRVRDSAYLEWIRTLPCLLRRGFSDACDKEIDAHHVGEPGHGKMGSKPDDRQTVPLCRFHHNVFHLVGLVEFESRFGLILAYEILKLQRAYRPKLKQKRDKKPGIICISVRCPCAQGSHDFAPSKVVHTESGLHWDCPVLRERIEVA